MQPVIQENQPEIHPIRRVLPIDITDYGLVKVRITKSGVTLPGEEWLQIIENGENIKNEILKQRRHISIFAIQRDPYFSQLEEVGPIQDIRFNQLFTTRLVPCEGKTNEEIIRKRHKIAKGTPINPTLFEDRYNLRKPPNSENMWDNHNNQRQFFNNIDARNDPDNQINQNIWHPEHGFPQGPVPVNPNPDPRYFNRRQPDQPPQEDDIPPRQRRRRN